MYNRLSIKNDISKIAPNQNWDKKETIDSIFFYKGKEIKEKNRLRIVGSVVDYLGDEMESVIWEDNLCGKYIYDYVDMFVAKIKGYKTIFNGKTQLTITYIEPISPDDIEYKELKKVYTEYKQKLSDEEKEQYVNELRELISKVHNKYYHRLLVDLFDDDMVTRFKEWTAAWERHHAFPGGLLVHTVNVAKKCLVIAGLEPEVDVDLLLTAALLHDIAKVKEYDSFPSKKRLYIGRTLGHASIGAEMVALKVNDYRRGIGENTLEVSDFPEVLEIQLKHCILSHHGRPEHGAAVTPLLLEAFLLHLMDDADAKIQYFKERVVDNGYTANLPADKMKGFYDGLSREYAYPTMRLEEYTEFNHCFELEDYVGEGVGDDFIPIPEAIEDIPTPFDNYNTNPIDNPDFFYGGNNIGPNGF